MPNWAKTTMKVIGPKPDLEKFFSDMHAAITPETAPNIESSWQENWLGNLFLKAGIPESDWEKYDLHPRGWVDDMCKCFDEDVPNVEILYQSAWDGRIKDFDIMLIKKYPTLKEISCVEEGGMQIFYTNDEDALFYSPYSNIIDLQYKNESYYGQNISDSAAIVDINSCMGTNFKSITDLKITVNKDKSSGDWCYYQKIDVIFDSIKEAKNIIKQAESNNKVK